MFTLVCDVYAEQCHALVKVFFLDSIQNPGNYLDHLLLSALACESSEDVAVQVAIGWLSGWLCQSLNGCH